MNPAEPPEEPGAREEPPRRERPDGVSAREILTVLRAERRGPMRRVAALLAPFRVGEEAPAIVEPTLYRLPQPRSKGELALPNVTERAVALGFRYLGTYELAGLFGFLPREAWVSSDGRTRLSARRGSATGVEGTMAAYVLTTIFDDGTGIETWSVSPPAVPSSVRAAALGGVGGLDADFATHEDAVDRYAGSHPGARVVLCDSLRESVELTRYFEHYLAADETIRLVVATRTIAYGTALGLVVALVYFFR